MKTFKDFLEAANRAQQAAIAIAKKKSGKYDKDGKRIKEAQGPCWDGYEQRGMKKRVREEAICRGGRREMSQEDMHHLSVLRSVLELSDEWFLLKAFYFARLPNYSSCAWEITSHFRLCRV